MLLSGKMSYMPALAAKTAPICNCCCRRPKAIFAALPFVVALMRKAAVADHRIFYLTLIGLLFADKIALN